MIRGLINVLMLVYDRVIPSSNIATLFGLSLMVLFATDAELFRRAARAHAVPVATLFDVGLREFIHTALATLPLRGTNERYLRESIRATRESDDK
jgi:ATP-binding cassette subfamily C protein PrsD